MSPGGGKRGRRAHPEGGSERAFFQKREPAALLAKGGRLFFFAGTVRGILISRASWDTHCQIGDDSAMTIPQRSPEINRVRSSAGLASILSPEKSGIERGWLARPAGWQSGISLTSEIGTPGRRSNGGRCARPEGNLSCLPPPQKREPAALGECGRLFCWPER